MYPTRIIECGSNLLLAYYYWSSWGRYSRPGQCGDAKWTYKEDIYSASCDRWIEAQLVYLLEGVWNTIMNDFHDFKLTIIKI